MTDHPDHTECHFTGPFTGLALVENVIRDVENLHGFLHERQADAEDGTPQYLCVGRMEWRREKQFRSRSKARAGKNLPKLAYGNGHRSGEAE